VAEYSLLELASRLAADPGEKAVYQNDPPGYLGSRGYGELSPTELHDALGHVADTVPPELAAVIDPSAGLDQLASADLAELGISELHGVPAEPAELAELDPTDDVDGFDDDPGDLDDLDDLEATTEAGLDEGGDADVDDLPSSAAEAATPAAAAPGGGSADDLDGLDDLDDGPASAEVPFPTQDDPFAELDDGVTFDADDHDDALQGFDQPDAEVPDDAPEGADSLWEDFDV
jgi:hypothetical protein